jgi:hypothetical protein
MLKAAFNQVVAAFVVREGSTDLHETNPKRTAQIDQSAVAMAWQNKAPKLGSASESKKCGAE